MIREGGVPKGKFAEANAFYQRGSLALSLRVLPVTVPTMAELGMPDFDTSIWFGLMAPTGTPQEIIDKLARAVPDAMQSAEAQTALKGQGFDQLSGGPEAFARFIVAETAKWNEAARAAGLKK